MTSIEQGVFENSSLLGLTVRQSTAILTKLVYLLNDKKSRVGQILLGREQGAWTQNDLRKIEVLLSSSSMDEKETRDLLRVLRKACAFHAAKEQLNLPYPRIPVILAEEQNPFRSNFATLLSRYEEWKELHADWLKQLAASNQTTESDESRPGIELVIASAVLYGGLYNIHSILALVRAIPHLDSRVSVSDGRVHVDLWLSWHGLPNMELRRWQPDELTATLLARMRTEDVESILQTDSSEESCSDRESSRRIRHLLRTRVEASGNQAKARMGGLDRLIQIAHAVAMIELPATLVAYGKRRYVSHSMSRAALQRMASSHIPMKIYPSGATLARASNASAPAQGPSQDLEPEWLMKFRADLPSADLNGLRNDLASLDNDQKTNPLVRRLAEWMGWMLDVRTPAGKVRSPKSVKRQAFHFGLAIGATIGLVDPATLDAEQLELAYGEMFESLGALEGNAKIDDALPVVARERSRLAREISEFHRFLMARHQKDAVESKMYMSAHTGLVPVDANPITLEDYYAILNAIDTGWPESRFPECRSIARILVILGFRCGLRRLEALFRLVEDIHPEANMILTIRPFGDVKLKSRNARRRIPLRFFLTDTELQEILTWREQRSAALASATNCFLLGGTSRNYAVVPQSIFLEINAILQRVTGDESMHFHQLRHSFASWTWLRLMLADMDNPPDLFPHLRSTTEWLRQSSVLRQQLQMHDRATRKHTYLLAQLLGHGSPMTSMEHYVHFADWMQAAYLEHSEIMRPDKHSIVHASGRSRMTIQRWKSDGIRMAVPCRLFEKRLQDQPPADESEISAQPGNQPRGRIRIAYAFLREAQNGIRPIHEIQQAAGLSPAEATRFIENARYLAGLRSGVGLRHRMESPATPDRQSATEIASPRGPSTGADEQIVDRFAPHLEHLVQQQPDLAHAALDCFAHRVWHNRSIVVFQHLDSADEARRYIEFLTSLGIARKDIRWFSFSTGERSRQMASWKQLLGLNRHNLIERISPPNASSYAAESWLGIGVRFNNSAAKSASDSTGSFGFRFLMVMGFIAYHPS